MALQNSSIINMKRFLNEYYLIPSYQREYSWDEENLDDFWTDLQRTVDDPDERANHFFGQIVIHNDTQHGKKYIIDGQQRTITSTIFLRSCQLLFRSLENNDVTEAANDYGEIQCDFIGRYSDSVNKLKLILGDSDADFFRDHIQRGTVENCPDSTKPSHKRLKKAFCYFTKKLIDVMGINNSYQDQYDNLLNYYQTFTEHFFVLSMEATELDEAFLIFETLNARGKDLETADLLKNYIFSHINPNSIINAQQSWKDMISSLDPIDATKYIRHFWNSKEPFAREKDLYRRICKSIDSPNKSKTFLNDLKQSAALYHDLVYPDEASSLIDEKLLKSLAAISILKASSFYPVILAMRHEGFSEADMAVVSGKIEAYIFRNFTICGKVANRAETFFAGVAKNISDGNLATYDEICSEISNGFVSDEEFENDFSIWVAKKSGKETIRYIFRKFHSFYDDLNEINLDNSGVHIEHIMPEDIAQWPQAASFHDDYLWRLGNLALLSGRRLNIPASNKPFDQKVVYYQQSTIKPNDRIESFASPNMVWDENAINNRQRALAKDALQIWK